MNGVDKRGVKYATEGSMSTPLEFEIGNESRSDALSNFSSGLCLQRKHEDIHVEILKKHLQNEFHQPRSGYLQLQYYHPENTSSHHCGDLLLQTPTFSSDVLYHVECASVKPVVNALDETSQYNAKVQKRFHKSPRQ